MRVSEAVNSRHSMRVFKPDPVPRADIEWIISTASRAASNGNLQPWKLYITQGKARQRLSAAILKAMDDGDTGPGRRIRRLSQGVHAGLRRPSQARRQAALHPARRAARRQPPAC